MTEPEKFKPDEYAPFDHLPPDHELNQRLIRVGSEAGSEPNLEDLPMINRLSEGMASISFGKLSWRDDNQDFHDMALETYEDHRLLTEIHGGETRIREHAGPQYDTWDLESMNRPMAILASDPHELIPMCKGWSWREIADYYLRHHIVCDVQVSTLCKENNAGAIRYPVKAGEIVCIYASCEPCEKWFLDPNRDDCAARTFGDEWGKRPWRGRSS